VVLPLVVLPLGASLDHLAATDWASLGTAAHGEMLAQLQRAQARFTTRRRSRAGRTSCPTASSAGQATMAQVLISFAELRREPGASAAERDWITAQAWPLLLIAIFFALSLHRYQRLSR